MECLITISGRNFDVDAFLAQFPSLRPTACWRRGGARSRRPAHEDSGLSLALREETRWEDLRVRTMRAIEVLAPVIKSAHEAGAEVGLDFALYVGGTPFTSSVSFSESDLRHLTALRGAVRVSAYPVADEAPARRSKPKRQEAKLGPKRKNGSRRTSRGGTA